MSISEESYQVPRWGSSSCQPKRGSTEKPVLEPVVEIDPLDTSGSDSLSRASSSDISNSTWGFGKDLTGRRGSSRRESIVAQHLHHIPQPPHPIRRSTPGCTMPIDDATIEGLHEVWDKVYRGGPGQGLTFPETVHSLSDLGVNRYRVDFITNTATAYIKGESWTYHFPSYATETLTPGTIPWSLEKLRISIKKAREDAKNNTPDLPNYTRQIIEAGVVDYTCFIEGRRVTYAGYLGEMYSAWFMGAGAEAPLNTGLARRNTTLR